MKFLANFSSDAPHFDEDFFSLAHAILLSIIYADVFDYPLTAAEIHRYLPGIGVSVEVVTDVLRDRRLVPGLIVRSGDYYTLPGRESICEIRRKRLQVAEQLWPRALYYGRMISRLPFVRMLAVTGSLAMNNVSNGADIDFLVVTATDHLWTCRALVIGVVRFARLQGFNVCPNYFISNRALEFTDRSLYTAHELTQMALLSGKAIYDQLRAVNSWTNDFLPNADGAANLQVELNLPAVSSEKRRGAEIILSTRPGIWFESWERERKIHKFFAQQNANSEVLFSQDICKGHFHHHGQDTERVLRQRLDERAVEFVL